MGKQTTQSTLIQPDIPNPGFSTSSAGTSGACQIVLGVMCVIFQISATAIGASMGDVAAGIWAGVFFMITGGIGLGAKNVSTCSIVMYMLFSFIGFFCSIAIVVLSAIGANDDRNNVSNFCDYHNFLDPYLDWNSKCHQAECKVAMNAMLIIFALINIFVTLYAQIVCCRGVCCCAPSYATVIEHHEHYGTSTLQQEIPVAVQQTYQQHQGYQQPTGRVVILVPSQDNPGQLIAVPYDGQTGQMPPVYGTTPPPGYSYNQQPAEVQAQQS